MTTSEPLSEDVLSAAERRPQQFAYPSFVRSLISDLNKARGYVEKLKLDISGHKGVIGQQVDLILSLQERLLKRLEEANILLEWRCEACNWRTVVPAPGFAGDGYTHPVCEESDGALVRQACGPLVARRVGGWARLPAGAAPAEIAEALESTR